MCELIAVPQRLRSFIVLIVSSTEADFCGTAITVIRAKNRLFQFQTYYSGACTGQIFCLIFSLYFTMRQHTKQGHFLP
tara:strand:+ start:141482 stop:141715 length:234 start_codon:yes stop_codon:yes gene_type:complete